MIEELEGTWKKAIFILLDILLPNFSGGTERNHDKSHSGYVTSPAKLGLRTPGIQVKSVTINLTSSVV
jgi:hypothetical protein